MESVSIFDNDGEHYRNSGVSQYLKKSYCGSMGNGSYPVGSGNFLQNGIGYLNQRMSKEDMTMCMKANLNNSSNELRMSGLSNGVQNDCFYDKQMANDILKFRMQSGQINECNLLRKSCDVQSA